MAPSEQRDEHALSANRAAPRVEALSVADVASGLELSDAAGWNQTGDDWSLFIERGHAIGCRDNGGHLVATAAALPYGGTAGWISMVLVDVAWRHRGLASGLLRECMAHLQTLGAAPFLDATPAGAAVYRGLGFNAGFAFERWQSSGSRGATRAGDEQRQADAKDLDSIASLDRSASGLERRFMLESFLSRPTTRAWLLADGHGFVIAREGRRATQIGPLVARHAEDAIRLLGSASRATQAQAFIDVPTSRHEIATWLERQGFARQRGFVRMSQGVAQAPPAVGEHCFALAGPEFG
jgi:hypothetical protein